MFNDKYSLTKAVLEGRKTQTRRFFTLNANQYVRVVALDNGSFFSYVAQKGKPSAFMGELELPEYDGELSPAYFIGEEVAVAQSYNTIIQEIFDKGGEYKGNCDIFRSKGLENKMFVKADLMPHSIKITNIRIERLQDICDSDCLKEGIMEWNPKDEAEGVVIKNLLEYNERNGHFPFQIPRCWNMYDTPRQAFADLFDKISGKGTWDSNPYVFVYEFELIK